MTDMRTLTEACRVIRSEFFGWEHQVVPDVPLRDALGILTVLCSEDGDGEVTIERIEETVSEAKQFAEGWINSPSDPTPNLDQSDAEDLFKIVRAGGDASGRYRSIIPARRTRVAVLVMTALVNDDSPTDEVQRFIEVIQSV